MPTINIAKSRIGHNYAATDDGSMTIDTTGVSS